MAVELATGYVSLTTEATELARNVRTALKSAVRGLDLDLGDAFGDLASDARAEAREAAREFEAGFKVDLPKLSTDFDISGTGELASLRGDIQRLDGQDIDVDVNVGSVDTDELVDGVGGAGEPAANSFLKKFGGVLGPGLGTVAVAAGGILLKGINDALGRDRDTSIFAAAFGGGEDEAERFGTLAGEIYGNAYGDSFAGILETIGAAVNIEGFDASDARFTELVTSAENLEAAFGGSAAEYLEFLGILEANGIADVDLGTDLLIEGFQTIPAGMRDSFQEALLEYAPFADALGFTAEETFAFLAALADQGEFAIDKGGDALKEFGIRATDMSTATVEAYGNIGLSAKQTSRDLLAGGEVARQAFSDIVDGILSIEDPVEQANTAIALFGTPLEDIGVNDIPAFLASLTDLENGFGSVGDASDALEQTVNDNTITRLTALWRGAGEALADVGEFFLPAIDEGIAFVEEFREILGAEGLGAALSFAGEEFGRLWDYVRPHLIEFGSNVLDFIKEQGPPFAEKLGELASEFIDWIAPMIPDMLAAFGVVFSEIGLWLATEGLSLVGDGLTAIALAVVAWAIDTASEGSATFIDAAGDMLNAGVEYIGGLLDGVTQKFGDVLDFFADLPGEIVGAVGDMSRTLVLVGRDVMSGLLTGMTNKWVDVSSWLSNRASEVAGFFTNALGIRSPSRVMFEIGEDTLEGFRIGLGSKASAIEAELSNVIDLTTSQFVSVSVPAVDIASNRNGGSQSINYQTVVNSQFVDSAAFAESTFEAVRREESLNGRRFLATSARGAG